MPQQPRLPQRPPPQTVVLKDVNKHYGDLHVLKDINLEIGKGEVVILIGPSGSGKSTLCRTINRLETFESGSITIDGKELPAGGQGAGRPARRRRHGLPVLQPLRAQDDPRERHARPDQGPQEEPRLQAEKRAMELARAGRRRPPGAKYPAQLSGGQQQRVAIARSWRWTPRSCSSTSRPRPSTPK
jgi:glutamate transport system ATP-binding protein